MRRVARQYTKDAAYLKRSMHRHLSSPCVLWEELPRAMEHADHSITDIRKSRGWIMSLPVVSPFPFFRVWRRMARDGHVIREGGRGQQNDLDPYLR